jgi:5-methylcytosine-specific restriction endonuclease McrBC regulatory subunit McrC
MPVIINNLTDNNYNSQIKSLKCLCPKGTAIAEMVKIRDELKPYSRRKLVELEKDNPNLMIYPPLIKESKDKIQEEVLFSLDNEYSDNPENTKITTSNLMGFFGINGNEIRIHSRFDFNPDNTNSDEEIPDNFLHYMLQKVFLPNVVDLPHSVNDNNSLNLLIFAFPKLLNNALKQGIIKEYQTHEYNDPNIHGTIDVQRHIRLNIPFNGKIAYKTREHSRDNFTTQLIRHTIELIKTTQFGEAILKADEITRNNVSLICQYTPTYSRNDRSLIIGKNLTPKVHPFYAAYYPLQKLCLQILRYETIGFIGKSEGLYGILFDGAWLWEEYLATILGKVHFTHPRNKEEIGSISVYSGNPRYPDFYKGMQYKEKIDIDNIDVISGELVNTWKNNFVLDAKYKQLNGKETDEISAHFSRDDLHQLITYMHILPAYKGGLIYPLKYSDSSHLIVSKTFKTIYGLGGKIATYGVPIPLYKKNEYDIFCSKMRNEIELSIINTFQWTL